MVRRQLLDLALDAGLRLVLDEEGGAAPTSSPP
jgi:hypothetical protein